MFTGLRILAEESAKPRLLSTSPMDDATSRPSSLGALLATLPRHLSERASLVAAGDPPAGAAYVVYWAHHALRTDENPALELACALADSRGLPVLVYSGLAGAHPYLSDRHATFVLEGLRDFAGQLAARGIPFAVNLDVASRPDAGIDRIASNAYAIVTEDFPAAPYSDWTASIARRTKRAVIAVDTACVVPMNKVDGVFDRAYAFREATERERAARVATPWPSPGPRGEPWPHVEHGLPEIDWRALDIARTVATLEIDHSVAPVADTPGGSAAGLARWNAFRETRLADYARDRNDAAIPGVSRMSAYLHYGMVSPMRVAREAHAAGADKYLEELLVWRELAYQWCRHVPDHSSFDALPSWARRTLRAHAADERAPLSWERLASGRTGDRLWDLAQRSLVMHGELHNNVRMTWGKAVLGWTPSPEAAIAMLIDLNNRFALDGADPASYGGILWCLGLFDRPFTPELPVLGTVRPRATEGHAARLDLDAYERHVSRRTRPWRVAVIGAGISGAACARTLAEHGIEVVVLEKSRGPGGRMSTRRGEAGEFDHGAQYFTARDARFAQRVASWCADGVVAEWRARFAAVGPFGASPVEAPSRFVAVPKMSVLCDWLLGFDRIRLSTGATVRTVERAGDGWRVSGTASDGTACDYGEFDLVLSTAPAQQTAALFAACAPKLSLSASRVAMRPTWALMWASLARVDLPFDHAEIREGVQGVGNALAWVSRVSSKPGRARDGVDRWTVLARPEWSVDHLERSPEEMARTLQDAFAALGAALGVFVPPPAHAAAHRWRYALAASEGGEGSVFDRELGLGCAGDWLRGTRVEDAYLAGVSLAGRALCEARQPSRAPVDAAASRAE
jgi:photolyase PhrII